MKSKKIKKIQPKKPAKTRRIKKTHEPVSLDPFFYQKCLLEHLREYAIGLDREGRIRYINSAFAHVFRERPENMIGRTIREYETRFQASVGFERILRETLAKSRWSGVLETKRHDGKIFHYAFRTYGVTDQRGHIIGLVGVATDISRERLSTEQLRRTETQQRQWFEIAFDGIFIMRSRRFVYVNPRLCELSGYTYEQMTDPEFDPALVLTNSFEPAAFGDDEPEPGRQRTLSLQILNQDGTGIDAEISAVSIEDQNGSALFGIVRDVSEERRNKQALKGKEHFFRSLFDHMGVGMAVSDSRGYLIRTNEAFQRMVGYNSEELMKIRASDITHPEDFEQEVLKMRELVSNPSLNFFQTDKRYIRKDGKIIWARLNSIVIRNEQENVDSVFGIIEDITEQKYAETLIRIQRDLSVSLSTATDLEKAMESVLSLSLRIEEISAGCLFLTDRWNHIHCVTQTNLSPVLIQKLPAIPEEKLRHSFFSDSRVRYFRYHDFILFLDVGFDEDLKHEDYRHVTILPVIHENEAIAAIVLFSAFYDRISSESREVLETIAAQLGGIIARLRMVDALITSEERYRRLLNSATDYVVSVIVKQGQPVKSYHGERCIAVTGYSPEDYERDHYLWFNMIYHEDQPKISELVRRVLNGETVPPLEHRFYHKDGSVRWIRHTVVSRYDQHGELAGYDALISDITGRKEAERQLIEQEEHYRAIFDGAQIGIFMETFDGKILSANPAACRMLDYTLEELKQITIEQIVPREYFDSVQILQTLDNDVPVIIAENIRKDGSRIWVEVIRRVVSIHGRLFALIFVQDITQRQRSESELLLQNTRFQQLFANNPLGMIMLDYRDRVLMANRAFCDIFQYSEAEALNREINTLIVPESMFEEATGLSDKTQHGEPVEFETVRRRKDGSPVDVHIWGVPIMLSRNQIGVFGIYADVSERKQAEKAIRDSEEKYRTLFEDSKDAVYISTPEGFFVDINTAGIQLFGYDSKEELLHTSIDSAIYQYPQDRGRFKAIMAEQGFIRDFEVSLKKKDGAAIDALVTATAEKDESGQITAYRGIIRDITSYKQLQRQLIQAQKMESIGTLSGGIAHDFNNVLAVVMSTAELIRKRAKGNADLTELTEMIIHSALRGRSITQQLLLFSRSDNPILRTLSLKDVIAENVKLLEHSLPKSITIQMHALTDNDTVMADLSHLHQIILNLAINARDAMPAGGTLTMVVDRIAGKEILKKWPDAEEQDYVALFISDSGPGIPPEIQTRIFDPFFTTKEQGKGTGLGLSIVHGIVKNHKGFIEVDSPPGMGATFRIYFPAIDQSTTVEDSLSNEIKSYTGNETILVVDDEPSLVQLLSDILSMSGYRVLPAQNGLEAIRIFHENSDDVKLVITDIGMPEMDGIQLFHHFKEICPGLPVVAATGYMGDNTSQNLFQEGLAEIIFKPYSVADILKMIRRILDRKNEQASQTE